MDVLLQNHNAKHVCDIPPGLRELCADISREVIRSQPDHIYCFIADYLNTLFITRENAKVAIQIVKSVTMKSEHIVEILVGTGLRLEEIAAVAPRLQKAFKVYLNAVDEQKKECGCDVDSDVDDENEISICQILRSTGASYPDAQRAAIKIQALFRGHQKRMSLAENRGEVQWQRAAAKTVDLLRKSGVTRAQATQAAIIIQAAYRGYYTRKNLKIRRARNGKEPNETVDMCVWFRMMFEESGITAQRANQAAIVIQIAYRRYRQRKSKDKLMIPSETSKRTFEQSRRNEDEDYPRSMKSEVKSEAISRSEIADAESKLDDDAKTATEVIGERAQEADAVEIKQEPPEASDVEAIENVDQVVDKVEDQTVNEHKEEENKGDEVKEDGHEEQNKGDEVKEHDEAEENKSAKVEEPVVEEKTEGAED